MSLLAPLGLAALSLLPIIVAIHLWRVRHRRLEVSSTLLWSRVLAELPLRRPRRLPSRLWLLLLELAVVACGAVALARPALVAAGAHRHVLVAVDTSLAMAATDVHPTRLDVAKNEVRALVAGLGADDTMTLVDLGTAPRVLVTSADHMTLTRAVDALRQGQGPSSLAGDGLLLSSLLRSYVPAGSRGDAAYLFAPVGVDGALLGALRRAAPGLQERLVGTGAGDRGVAGLTVSCTTSSCEAYARLVNTAASPVTTRLTASVDTQSVTKTVTLPAHSALPIGLTLPVTLRSGVHAVKLRLAGHDALPADDVAWATIPLDIHRKVLLVTSDPSSALAQALRAVPGVMLSTTAPDVYSDNMTQHVDLTVLDNTGADVQPPGNLLVVNPTDSTSFFNLSGTQNAPGVEVISQPGETVSAGDAGALPQPDLLRGVDLSSLVVSAASTARLPRWAHVDIEGDSGPLLFSGITGGRRVAVLLFDPRATADSNASNLDTLLAFPALIANAVETLAPAPPVSAPAGQTDALAAARQGLAWIEPLHGGARLALPSSGDFAALPALRPGLYTAGGALGLGAQPIAVNAPVPGDTLSAAGVPAAAAPSAPVVLAPSLIAPWEGWAGLAVLALIALSGEWWYYVRRT